MPRRESPSKSHLPSLRHRPNVNVEDQTDAMRKEQISSSLNSIHISPRVPSMARHSRRTLDEDERNGVQLALLSEERDDAHDDAASFDNNVHKKQKTLSVKDRKAMTLLIVLCPSTFHHLSIAQALTLLRPHSRDSGE